MRAGHKTFRVAGRCVEHDDLAWRFGDGSVCCMRQLIVERSSADCTWGPMPPEWLGDKGQGVAL